MKSKLKKKKRGAQGGVSMKRRRALYETRETIKTHPRWRQLPGGRTGATDERKNSL